MNSKHDEFEKISDRIAQAKGDCALLLIDRIVEALKAAGTDIDDMGELCRSVVSGQFNDPAAAYALADFTHDQSDVDAVKAEAMRMMVDDERHDRQAPDGD